MEPLTFMVVARLNHSVSCQFMQTDLQENQNSAIPLSESRTSGLVPAHQTLWTTAVVWERHDISGRGQILQVVLLRSWLDNPASSLPDARRGSGLPWKRFCITGGHWRCTLVCQNNSFMCKLTLSVESVSGRESSVEPNLSCRGGSNSRLLRAYSCL